MKKLLTVFGTMLSLFSVSSSASASQVTVSQPFRLMVGEPSVFEFQAPRGTLSVVFEDDGETGYFYALDYSSASQPIQEAVHIYDVMSVVGRDRPSVVRIAWSADATKASLWINDYPHAVFDFAAKRGYARSNFPPPRKWKSHDFSWDDQILKYFR